MFPLNFMANRRVPKFSLNNCAQSPKKTFMCPKFCTNPVLMYTKCHISTNLSSFLKLCLLYCQKYLPLLQQIADLLKKISLVEILMVTIEPISINESVFLLGTSRLIFGFSIVCYRKITNFLGTNQLTKS